VISENEQTAGVVLALQRSTHVVLYKLSTALADLHLNPAEVNVLANLAGQGSPDVGQLSVSQHSVSQHSVSQLGAATGTRPSTLTSLLDRLEQRGYLVRELDAADRRSFRLALTDSGRQVAAHVAATIADLERETLGGLTAQQLAGFHAVLAALTSTGT